MSSGKYYEVCSYCYAAAGYKELDGKMPKEMFRHYGDERDGGMSLLDETSQDDFDKWFKLSTQEKWEIENPSHMWEISCGHTHTMIHLYLFLSDCLFACFFNCFLYFIIAVTCDIANIGCEKSIFGPEYFITSFISARYSGL